MLSDCNQTEMGISVVNYKFHTVMMQCEMFGGFIVVADPSNQTKFSQTQLP